MVVLLIQDGAELIYDGYVGNGWYHQWGNGENYLCLPKDPQYLSITYSRC